MENNPTIQDAIAMYRFLESMKKERSPDPERDIDILAFNQFLSSKQADVYLWIMEYFDDNFKFEDKEWGDPMDHFRKIKM